MKHVDGWHWPDNEQHLLDWLANPKGRMMLNGRLAYQGKKQQALLDACPADRRRTFIDVGAHIGLWSYNFSHWFKTVEAFEPVAMHQDCFRKNVLGVLGTGQVTLNPFALGEKPGKVRMITGPASTGDTRVDTSHISNSALVEMRTLDNYKFADVDAIKIDCEGFEEFVLRGAEETIVTWRPVICVEQKRDMAKRFGLQSLGAVKYLTTLGYKTAQEISGDFIMVPA